MQTIRPPDRETRTNLILRYIGALLYVVAGINHFLKPDWYRKIVPPHFPAPAALVAISGVAEIAGGLGLLVRPIRRAAGWGLIALLIAVFPANVYMAFAPTSLAGQSIPRWLLWLRLPLQGVLIAWVWEVALRQRTSRKDGLVPAPQ